MKRTDFYFCLIVVALFAPFVLSSSLYAGYQSFNAEHGMVMSFLKFAVLSTLGELLGLRISTGQYLRKGFGVLPRAVVWGVLGMGINLAFIVFSTGVPAAAGYLGVDDPAAIMAGPVTLSKVLLAFAISVCLNSIFAPVFMTFHKITDTHILATGGTLRGLFTPIPMGDIMKNLNWQVQWNFVFKKTIPFFWFPAHTITFLLPGEMRVLFAALLGVALGVILAVAARKK
ncbi:hypothetical protein [Mediterranea massiliensis]|uniref:hypothetical protein n=1 Tax=Mediterranea massiliensis TaxID=1841865 RepID=UPI00266BE14D|nr:hypothetical protein [Mediterranea massiliensis]